MGERIAYKYYIRFSTRTVSLKTFCKSRYIQIIRHPDKINLTKNINNFYLSNIDVLTVCR